MGRYKYRKIYIIPQNKREEVNTYLENKGYGPDNFSVALERPSGTTTHYLCDVQLDNDMLTAFRDAISSAGGKEKDTDSVEKADRLSTVLKSESLSLKEI